MSELSIGTTVQLKNGKTCKVKKELGRGGQGIVYAVDYGGGDYALKWYIEPSIMSSTSVHEILLTLPINDYGTKKYRENSTLHI